MIAGRWRLPLLAAVLTLVAALPAAGLRADEQKVRIGWLSQTVKRSWPLTYLDQPPEDEGIEGARLGIHDNNTTGQFTGPWSLFHLLQMADTQNGGTFVFQTVQFGHGLNPLVNEHGQPGTIQIHVTSSAGNPLARGYFSRLRCADSWALQPRTP